MSRKQRLELTWIGKEERPKLEPRILLEEPSRSHVGMNSKEGDLFDNSIIFGDNLLALKAIERNYSSRIRCVYIDPPYNTGSAIEEYNDGLEHSLWLSLMRDRLHLLRELLTDDGSIWINLDDNEAHYARVLCDEIFGRRNFVSTVVWQKKYAPKADTKFISSSHDFILVYAKDIDRLRLNRIPKDEKQVSRYTNRDNDPRGPWKAGDVLRNEARDYAIFPVTLPSGRQVMPPSGTSWRYTKDKFADLVADNRIWFGVDGDARPALKRFLSEVTDTIPAQSIWTFQEVGHNDEAKKESRALFGDALFSTPKPERLIQRVLTLSTDPGDVVLDSFAGSGTTGAVAHKMGRRWIMVELRDQAFTHIAPRMKKVVDGVDMGGITEAVEWKGGGGFRFYRLAPSLLEKDRFGNWVISKEYNPSMLAEAMCKHLGFTFAPSQEPGEYWRHGHSTEADFIYVTTQSLTYDALKKLSEEVGPKRTLLVCCKAFNAKEDTFPNLTVKKIPHAILARCEWGRDDYSLRVASLPSAEELDVVASDKLPATQGRDGKTRATASLPLFADEEE
ncbi:site-specific DNA-methyltransferase [Microvirga sp. M2]|uniref:site-specific DNA-methyltransferase n=1 Tax=Microvirga sp. M2 TaxID=3073270 RepID=UPI0039C2F0FD